MGRFTLSVVAVLAFLQCVAGPARAQTADDKPLGARMQEFVTLNKKLADLFAGKEYEKAAEVCRKQMELIPESDEPFYNLACAEARMGHVEAALLNLGEAVKMGFTDVAHMRVDADLESLHNERKFKDLIQQVRDKQLNAPFEHGEKMEGIKTIEGFPEGGLRYRLRMPPATDAKKLARLIIWLHPSGGSMDSTVEAMAPDLAKNGFALLVLTQKNYAFWSPQDAEELMGKTVPDVAKIEGIDAKKPILLGFSAGGQLALQMWEAHPEIYGGLILDSAYPLDTQQFATGKLAPMALPKNDAIKSCPIYVLVGGADGGSNLWRAVAKSWTQAGIPLTVHVIPDRKHEWLIDKNQAGTLYGWLKRVAAGGLPTGGDLEGPGPHPKLPGDTGSEPIKVKWEGTATGKPARRAA